MQTFSQNGGENYHRGSETSLWFENRLPHCFVWQSNGFLDINIANFSNFFDKICNFKF